ncbi:zinc-dependent peptidase [Ramlibacter rhizophilus]|uniref:Zinc-dependent peptidase n=1 Tax=Ramlibacter rhizophilus TaxID=1781167 RepID=A0A4Z0BZI8_9BURK|nr:M90 family metallopeptidase [Ramlibacter rhizophilus]TFZ04663.1 zinc-dependent peptidase [Ramlibacter rhizophilus]
MFGWLRRRLPPPQIPESLWRGVLRDYPFLAARSPAERERLREMSARFLQDKEFNGVHGLEITDETALAIAAQAVLPVLHLGLSWYDDFVGIVVHPGEALARRTATDEAGVVHQYDEVLAGEAMDRGPVMLSWSDVKAGGRLAHEGYNLVIHEFAHKLDLRDGAADGCPPLRSAHGRQAWLTVLREDYDRFREQVVMAERFGAEAPWLNAYGATDHGEFFAVACEAYFVNRERFAREFPRLLALFDGFFQPAA